MPLFSVAGKQGSEVFWLAKAELTAVVYPKCQRVADQFGFELVDVALDRENTGKYLRIYIDREEGMDLDSCEKYHRAIQPLLEDYDYDFLEVSSPGLDRPLKTDRDLERAEGQEVEVKLFSPLEGKKEWSGVLKAFDRDSIVLDIGGAERTIARRACAAIRLCVDMSGVEEVDLTGSGEAWTEGEEKS